MKRLGAPYVCTRDWSIRMAHAERARASVPRQRTETAHSPAPVRDRPPMGFLSLVPASVATLLRGSLRAQPPKASARSGGLSCSLPRSCGQQLLAPAAQVIAISMKSSSGAPASSTGAHAGAHGGRRRSAFRLPGAHVLLLLEYRERRLPLWRRHACRLAGRTWSSADGSICGERALAARARASNSASTDDLKLPRPPLCVNITITPW